MLFNKAFVDVKTRMPSMTYYTHRTVGVTWASLSINKTVGGTAECIGLDLGPHPTGLDSGP